LEIGDGEALLGKPPVAAGAFWAASAFGFPLSALAGISQTTRKPW